MLTIKNLKKTYNQKTIFKNLNLTVPNGGILTVVGPSGIGKTTFLNILAGLTSADAGKIILDGKQLELDPRRKSTDVGVIFQDFNLFLQYTVTENVTLAPKVVKKERPSQYQKQSDQLLAELDLSDKKDSYPFQLSGGQKQRVSIARALAMNPGILAYDEPTSGLDKKATERVTEVIQKLQQRGVTQIVVTHDLPFAKSLTGEVLDFGKDVER
ncbi:polar amino acid ABC transporter ATP-binding protein [Fructilactobacillus lindneri]|uniref:Arginine transport ATP-binding protein artM n=2 Tax=Fructilactobacillus lindneri TaxID=53444 RepID=A0A0R2JMM5_9LACO|nr:ATP-binding cassette domain-containing protein [Fructilactobacillus lindneri]ANZ57672.1 polar amino acid ABC transporter ATP-binding protein [Fructilactobacillus lindneri]ANZ58942.1 polar amino acid ABC transporter ATP-binding protein [Fructilactobacillus lindneri]KRN78408.1 arginine transport ATP-binding protein artM [Fructilactobacillus lindneri DSM 20690 = JCM 11027]POG97967.1 polar amino acid ABC transporter ATP-binding protein [Fructilactobacillus lindneri]POG99021.1 polar amino acid A